MTGIGGAAYPCPCGAHNIHRRPREPSAVVSLDGPRCFPGVVSFVESVCSDRVLSPRSESLQSSRFPPHSANAARDACRVVLAFNVARADGDQSSMFWISTSSPDVSHIPVSVSTTK